MKYRFDRKYYFLSKIAFHLLLKLRKYHQQDDQLLVFSNDFIGINLYSKGVYERHELMSILNSISKETKAQTCLDIGANIGNHSVQFAKKFKQVNAFEPNKRAFNVLQLNVNRYSNIVTYNFGLSMSPSTTYIEYDQKNLGSGKVVNHVTENKIELKKYDDEFDETFSFVKIDVEGHELSVLKGMATNISTYKPIVCFEANYGINNELDQILNFLKDLGYNQFFTPIEQNFLHEKFNYTLKPLFGLIFGLFFPKYQNRHGLKEIKHINRSYNMVLAVHPQSSFTVI